MLDEEPLAAEGNRRPARKLPSRDHYGPTRHLTMSLLSQVLASLTPAQYTPTPFEEYEGFQYKWKIFVFRPGREYLIFYVSSSYSKSLPTSLSN